MQPWQTVPKGFDKAGKLFAMYICIHVRILVGTLSSAASLCFFRLGVGM